MRLVKQLVAVAAVAFAGNALVGAVPGNAFFTLIFGSLYVARERGNLVPRRRRTDATLVRTP